MRTTEQTGAAPHADGPTVAIIVGSTRPGRKADTVAHWVHGIAARREDATYDAIDFLYAEWNDKAAGFVGYGIQGGVRAVEHLRQILSDLAVIGTRSTVALTFAEDFQDYTRFTPGDPQPKNVTAMLDELVAHATKLR